MRNLLPCWDEPNSAPLFSKRSGHGLLWGGYVLVVERNRPAILATLHLPFALLIATHTFPDTYALPPSICRIIITVSAAVHHHVFTRE
jgi:hypothetical protein